MPDDPSTEDFRAPGFSTRAIHEAALPQGIAEEPVSPPIWLTADYLYDDLEHYGDVINERRPGYVYARYGNPTHVALHRLLASLEGAEAAFSFSSGMGAMHTALTALVRSGQEVLAQRTIYGGTFSLLKGMFGRYGMTVRFSDPDAESVSTAIGDSTGAVLVETLANPTFDVCDLPGIAAVCARRGIPLIVDNTVATPWLLRPLDFEGVTLVVHSTSKYIGGHSDLIGGAVAGSRALIAHLRHVAQEQGTTSSAFDAWLTIRGVQTLPLRMQRQCSTALRLAQVLDRHPKVDHVGYAGLPDHIEHTRASALFGGKGFGAMLAVSFKGGYEAASRAARALRVARVGSSFGGLHSEVCHPATTSHRQYSAEEREAAGIGDGLLRVAVGGEDPEDLEEDFLQALAKA